MAVQGQAMPEPERAAFGRDVRRDEARRGPALADEAERGPSVVVGPPQGNPGPSPGAAGATAPVPEPPRGPSVLVTRLRPSFLRPTHAPFLRALKEGGHDPLAFRRNRLWVWALLGLLLLTAFALFPLAIPETGAWVMRIDTFLSLVFLVAAVGLWLGMGSRAFVVGAVVALALYGLTAFLGVGFALADVQSVPVLVAFLVFALAGFNLVFVLEEMVHDAHRILHPRGPLLAGLMIGLSALVAFGIPFWHARGGPAFPVLWATSLASIIVLGAFAIARALGIVPRRRATQAVLRELHLFAVGAMAAAALVDGVGLLQQVQGLLPSILAYGSLIGTWIYVTYTTLQRTHFLLKGDDPRPWVAILLAASFAILAHTEALYKQEGARAVDELLSRRVAFLAWGAWIGIGLYLLRGAWAGLTWWRTALAGRRLVGGAAGVAADVAAGLLSTEDKLERGAYALFRGLDEVLPGAKHPPHRPVLGWQRDLGVVLDGSRVEPELTEVMAEGAD